MARKPTITEDGYVLITGTPKEKTLHHLREAKALLASEGLTLSQFVDQHWSEL